MKKPENQKHEHTIEYYKERNEELEAKLKWYEEQFRLLQKKKYGALSEKTNENQLSLSFFNEAENTSDFKKEEPELDKIIYTRKRTKRTRETLIEIIEYEISPEEQVCLCYGHDTQKMDECRSSKRTSSNLCPGKSCEACSSCICLSPL